MNSMFLVIDSSCQSYHYIHIHSDTCTPAQKFTSLIPKQLSPA